MNNVRKYLIRLRDEPHWWELLLYPIVVGVTIGWYLGSLVIYALR